MVADGSAAPVAREFAEEGFGGDPDLLIAVDEVLDRLSSIDPRKYEVVQLRYFAGLTVDETAAAVGISPRTVDADLRFARAWLHRELGQHVEME